MILDFECRQHGDVAHLLRCQPAAGDSLTGSRSFGRCRAATEIIVVADSSKFGRIYLQKVVTDAGIPLEDREALTRNAIEVIV